MSYDTKVIMKRKNIRLAGVARGLKATKIVNILFIFVLSWCNLAQADQSCVDATETSSVVLSGNLSSAATIIAPSAIPPVSVAGDIECRSEVIPLRRSRDLAIGAELSNPRTS